MTRSTRLMLQKTPETDNMKIMTLNTHSLAEPDYESKLTEMCIRDSRKGAGQWSPPS